VEDPSRREKRNVSVERIYADFLTTFLPIVVLAKIVPYVLHLAIHCFFVLLLFPIPLIASLSLTKHFRSTSHAAAAAADDDDATNLGYLSDGDDTDNTAKNVRRYANNIVYHVS
jgi:hypothetical protein